MWTWCLQTARCCTITIHAGLAQFPGMKALRNTKIYNADIEKCKVAALLHDICKEMDMEYIKNICKDNFMSQFYDSQIKKRKPER